MKIKTNIKAGGIHRNHNETLLRGSTDQITANDPWLGNVTHRANTPQDLQWEETLAGTLFGLLYHPAPPPINPSVDSRQSI